MVTRQTPEEAVRRFVQTLHYLQKEALDMGWSNVARMLEPALQQAIRRALKVLEAENRASESGARDSFAE